MCNMGSTQDLIHSYLERISASPTELHSLIDCYTLSCKSRREWGFPVYDPTNPQKVVRVFSSFDSSLDPQSQPCRCGKVLSLLKNDWYVDEAGCSYHWGKRSFCGGPENGLFSCCKGYSSTDGCVHHKYHVSSYKPMKSDGFVKTEVAKSKRSSKCFKQFPWHANLSNIYALDCEMVYTTAGLEVARVSLVAVCGNTVYDAFVQPPNTILDYNTIFSGITSQDLENVTNTLSNARDCILKLLNKDSILIGHGLENDLVGLHILHDNLVDTSILYRHEKGFPFRHSLKTLAEKYLKKTSVRDHDSVEDAKISIALMLHKLNSDLDLCLPASVKSKSCPFVQYKVLSSYSTEYLIYYRNPVIIFPKVVQLSFPKYSTLSPPAVAFCPTTVYQYIGRSNYGM